jgi:hypothetical protein
MPKDDIDFDLHGHCVKCHEDMSIVEIIDGKPERRLTGKYMEEEYLLNDGSNMRVAICKDCQGKLKDDEEERISIMTCVYTGWEHELKNYSHWSNEKKVNHLKVYKKKAIVTRTRGLGKDLLQKRLKKFNNKGKSHGSNNKT